MHQNSKAGAALKHVLQIWQKAFFCGIAYRFQCYSQKCKEGKYFRLVASVNSRHAMGDGATLVMNEGLAVPYKEQGKRYNWCKARIYTN